MTGLRSRRPAARRAVYVATVSGKGAAELERTALVRARLYFAGEDMTTLAVECHAARSAGRDDQQRQSFTADITVSCDVGARRLDCPRCRQKVAVRDGAPAVHDRVRVQHRPGEPARAWAEPCEDTGGAR